MRESASFLPLSCALYALPCSALLYFPSSAVPRTPSVLLSFSSLCLTMRSPTPSLPSSPVLEHRLALLCFARPGLVTHMHTRISLPLSHHFSQGSNPCTDLTSPLPSPPASRPSSNCTLNATTATPASRLTTTQRIPRQPSRSYPPAQPHQPLPQQQWRRRNQHQDQQQQRHQPSTRTKPPPRNKTRTSSARASWSSCITKSERGVGRGSWRRGWPRRGARSSVLSAAESIPETH